MERLEAPDMPLGLTMSLAEDLEAMQTFSNLSATAQAQIVNYIQDSTTGDEAKSRIENAVKNLHNHCTLF
ncbi:MAG: hypothetical protein RR324_09165 [Cellulosilyticaceae bacterium]